jgi:hypothetical protein
LTPQRHPSRTRGLAAPGWFALLATLVVAFGFVVMAGPARVAADNVEDDAGSPEACMDANDYQGFADFVESSAPWQVTAPANSVIVGICIESESNSGRFAAPDGTGTCQNVDTDEGSSLHSPCITGNGVYSVNSCYEVSGIGTQTVVVDFAPQSDCTGINHIDYKYETTGFLKYTDPEDEFVEQHEVFNWYISVPAGMGPWIVSDRLPPGFIIVGMAMPMNQCETFLVYFRCWGVSNEAVLITVPVLAPITCGNFTNTAELFSQTKHPWLRASDTVNVDCQHQKLEGMNPDAVSTSSSASSAVSGAIDWLKALLQR